MIIAWGLMSENLVPNKKILEILSLISMNKLEANYRNFYEYAYHSLRKSGIKTGSKRKFYDTYTMGALSP